MSITESVSRQQRFTNISLIAHVGGAEVHNFRGAPLWQLPHDIGEMNHMKLITTSVHQLPSQNPMSQSLQGIKSCAVHNSWSQPNSEIRGNSSITARCTDSDQFQRQLMTSVNSCRE